MDIGIVCEGPTDFLALRSIASNLLPGNHLFLPLQPVGPLSGPFVGGAGWKGVERWIYENITLAGVSVKTYMSSATGPALDLLIIHLDCEVVEEPDLQVNVIPTEPTPAVLCPPVHNSADFLRRIALRWLNAPQSDLDRVVFAFPGQELETWAFAAFHSDDPKCAQQDFECKHVGVKRPSYLLTTKAYGAHLKYKDGKVKKSTATYGRIAAKISDNWPDVTAVCSLARAFETELLKAVSQ